MTKIILILFLSIAANAGNTAHNLRKCLLAPVTDSIGGAVGYPLLIKVEKYLKESSWCEYNHNSEILNILDQYSKDIKDHLQNREVLKLLADKTDSGSIIRIDITKISGEYIYLLDVIDGNNLDIIFSQKGTSESENLDLLASQLTGALNDYSNEIPYDGLITGVLGDQFTTDISKSFIRAQDSKVEIFAPTGVRKHPLFNQVVEWKKEEVASGKIFLQTDVAAQGKAISYYGKRKLDKGFWVKVDKKTSLGPQIAFNDDDKDAYSFGKMGMVRAGLVLGSQELSITDDDDFRTLESGMFGMSVAGELWITRNYIAGIDVVNTFSTLEKKNGSFSRKEYSGDISETTIYAGYRYLPMGFFYGPKIDFYLGYTSKSFSTEYSKQDGITEFKIRGVTVGAKGSIPLVRNYRFGIGVKFALSPGYAEDVALYGDADSASYFNFETGVEYSYGPNTSFTGKVNITSASADFVSPARKLKSKEQSLVFGTLFTF